MGVGEMGDWEYPPGVRTNEVLLYVLTKNRIIEKNKRLRLKNMLTFTINRFYT